ncbi:Utp14-domain-containing protein [Xylariaceae sp. FL0255]|nr:Utp14-domain-containing protein [Xylariaceae sp. FL0255]
MPGRQSHGRPLLASHGGSGKGKNKRSKSRANSKALNAFAAAQAEVGDQQKRTPRYRQLDADLNDDAPRGKHARDEDDDDEDDEEDEAPPKKMRRNARDEEDDDVEYGSDSSGNSWRIGVVDDDDDSEIDSDEAFGESDDERFEDYRFRGSKQKKKRKGKADEDDDDEDDDNEEIDDADGASLGSDAIDLADALDMSMSDDDDQPDGEQDDDDDDDEDSDDEAEEDGSGDESSDVETDADEAPEGDIDAWVSQFGGAKDDEEDEAPVAKPKISLKDLGLTSVKDAELKKSVKLMSKEDRATKRQKLEVPLARRAQAKLDRSVAYEKTNESMGRWLETVKSMRRTDSSLVFPLPQHEVGLARHDNSEIVPLTQKNAGTELENTIMAIMEESGLNISTKPTEQPVVVDEDGQVISRKALNAQRRRERELKSREEARAKRIKKIKSKAYRRVHRKQNEREEAREREGMEVDSEEEREAQDRQRAMERMGARHRESKWAKQSNKNGRAAWDDDVRMGVAEMAKRDEELRRRIEGKSRQQGSDDEEDESDDSADSQVDERAKLLRQLKAIDQEEDSEPKSKLMSMDFMKKAEARRKQANDELIAEIRRDLASDGEEQSDSDDQGPGDIGRRIFGQPKDSKFAKKASKAEKKAKSQTSAEAGEDTTNTAAWSGDKPGVLSGSTSRNSDLPAAASAWSQAPMAGSAKKRKGKGLVPSKTILDLDGADDSIIHSSAKPSQQTRKNNSAATAQAAAEYSSSDEDGHLPLQIQDQKLLERAFGGLEALEEFQKEKDEIMAEDDEKTVETTLPGWGSWVGEGIKKDNKHKRFFTKKEGIKPQDRKDAKMANVIINEKRVKKNDKYLATQLPHQYESRAQYERSMRLPIGPEFLTKESFQAATKPRVLVKQGIIAPISRPTH